MTCAFDLDHYRELLDAARTGGYRFTHFDHPPTTGDVLLRHDVDLSLDAAIRMAEVEHEADAGATYFLMTRSEFYNLDSPSGDAAIERLRGLGHRVGVHAVWLQVDRDRRFDALLAWHNPDPEYMHAEIEGAVNVMRPPFFEQGHYRSDSNQHWRHGCPDSELAAGSFAWLQLLIHPEIWAYAGSTMRETMESFLDADREVRLERLRHDRIDLS